MSLDLRRFKELIPGVIERKKSETVQLFQHLICLLIIGLIIGIACLPLNQIDHIQKLLFQHLPTTSQSVWQPIGLILALLPIGVMPILLLLQRGPWRDGAGSGIPQTMNALDDQSQLNSALAAPRTIQRSILWSIATLAMFPLGREGPVVQVGAAVARAIHQRLKHWLPSLNERQIVAIGGGAGLAGAFNTPLLGPIFMLEELTAEYSLNLIWPALVIGIGAAWFSNLGGIPIFGLGVINVMVPESEQLLIALPIGLAAGFLGGFFNRGLVWCTSRLEPFISKRPIRTGVILGICLSLLAITSWGASAGDGEALLEQLIEDGIPNPFPDGGSLLKGFSSLWIIMVRVLAPLIALASGVPGGLIDPSLAFGGVLGYTICEVLGSSTHLGLALGMAAGLAGVTQLPLVSILFAWRLVGDQQLFAGVVLCSVLAAYVGRLIAREPVYHALAKLQRPKRR
ncbi:MAG: chloride channel protein [Prochlorococcaceae cyanobacterium ETNP2_MAG_10]|nr:chloride channel protein [Prochlorococcaceae cyanobacterium ETNP2_MAG_10]